MERKTWQTMDKAGWGDGPWQHEPDKEQWQDKATGYACLVKRNHLGALCGYVGVPEGHPWHGVGPDSIRTADGEYPDVHGGLTYSDLCQEGDEAHTICHVPGPGEPEPLWWLGFVCGNAFDLQPAMVARERAMGLPDFEDVIAHYHAPWARMVYRDIAYVRSECAALARQAADVAGNF